MAGDRIGERLLLDTAGVRVWQDRVPPGGAQPLHTHRRPYLSVMVSGAHGEIVGDGGEVRYRVDRAPGEVAYFGADRLPTTHRLRNTGDAEIVVVVVELPAP